MLAKQKQKEQDEEPRLCSTDRGSATQEKDRTKLWRNLDL